MKRPLLCAVTAAACALSACTAEPTPELGGASLGLSAVATENALAGTPGWQLAKPADARQIEGYASATSVNAGGAVDLYVNLTGGPAPYTLEVFRMGWYGGVGARRVRGPIVATGLTQPPPTVDSFGAVSCAWTAPYRLATDDTWVSGVYLVKLTHRGTGHQSWIPLVVRNDTRTATFVLQLAVATYQGHNSWPLYPLGNPDSSKGRSLDPDTSAAGTPARKVSFDRPYGRGRADSTLSGVGAGQFFTHDHPGNNGAAGWEYSMIRWLEREGYDVVYQTDLDAHQGADLTRYRGLLLAGHSEYWSVPMRFAFRVAQEAGSSVAVFGAETSSWNVRFEPAGGRPDRVMVAYKDAVADDPQVGTRDETWRFTSTALRTTQVGLDAAGDLSEASLSGATGFGGDVADQAMTVGGGYTCDPLRRGTGIADGDKVLDLLGHRVSFSVSGAGVWSRTSPVEGTRSPALPTSSSCQPAGGKLCADLVSYTSGGGIGFSAGTVQWSWGLDDYQAGAAPGEPLLRTSRRDARIEQLTRNVLARMVSASVPADLLGSHGYALALDGQRQALVVSHQPQYNALPISLAAWVRTDSDGGIISKYASGSQNGYQLFVWDGRLRAWYFGDASHHVWGGGLGLDGGPIADGRWHHVAFAVDASGGRLYRDGRMVASLPWSGAPLTTTTTESVHIGSYPGSSRSYLRGAIDEAAIWTSALTAPQAGALAARTLTAFAIAGRMLHFQFNDPAGSETSAMPAYSPQRNGAYAEPVECRVASSLGQGTATETFAPRFSDANGWAAAAHRATLAYPDVDGDGKVDLCGRGAAGLECWATTGGHVQTGRFSDVDGWAQPQYYETIRFGDLDGDHAADVCARGAAGIRCYLGAGAPLSVEVTGPALSDQAGWDQPAYYRTIQFADVDGDGNDELCARGSAGLWCWDYTQGAFAEPTLVAELGDAAGWNQPGYYRTIQFADIDGDGKDDPCYRGAAGLACAPVTASGARQETLLAPLSDASGWNQPQYYDTIQFADINGDGKDDPCYRGSAGFKCVPSLPGAGARGPEQVVAPLSDEAGWANPAHYETIRLGDVNHDGSADVCARASAGVRCWLSKAGVFSTPALPGPDFADAAGYAQPSIYSTFRLVDYDGDGDDDFCIRASAGVRCVFSRLPRP